MIQKQETAQKVAVKCPTCGTTNMKLPSYADRQFCDRNCYQAYGKKAGLVQNKPETKKVRILCAGCNTPKMIYSHDKKEKNYCTHSCYIKSTQISKEGLFTEQRVRHTREDNYAWMDIWAGYSSIHKHLMLVKGKPTYCVDCGVTSQEKKIQWSNNDGLYSRNPDDYAGRCGGCHFQHDKSLGYGVRDWFDFSTGQAGRRLYIPEIFMLRQ